MAVKRAPQLSGKQQYNEYASISKADIVEAYRDLFREFGGEGELDDVEWMIDLKRRIELLKAYRNAESEK
jgi:hypothetical protein